MSRRDKSVSKRNALKRESRNFVHHTQNSRVFATREHVRQVLASCARTWKMHTQLGDSCQLIMFGNCLRNLFASVERDSRMKGNDASQISRGENNRRAMRCNVGNPGITRIDSACDYPRQQMLFTLFAVRDIRVRILPEPSDDEKTRVCIYIVINHGFRRPTPILIIEMA